VAKKMRVDHSRGARRSSKSFHTCAALSLLLFMVLVLSGSREVDKKRRVEESKVQELKEERKSKAEHRERRDAAQRKALAPQARYNISLPAAGRLRVNSNDASTC